MDEWLDDFDLFKLFITKEIKIYNENNSMILLAPTMKDQITNKDLSFFLNYFRRPFEDQRSDFKIWDPKDTYDIFLIILLLSPYKEFIKISTLLKSGFNNLFKEEITFEKDNIKIGNVYLTRNLWNYIFFIIAECFGEKVTKPIIYKTEEERKFFDEMKKNEEKIKGIRLRGNPAETNSEEVLKTFVNITYAFPQFTFDYLFDQTNAQVIWLQKYASKANSYEVESKAYAAGNMKKKLKFFLEK